MYRATRELIRERSKHCHQRLPAFVKVKSQPIGELGNCFHNAVGSQTKDVLSSGSSNNHIRSGWVIHPHSRGDEITEIIQHWWNYDPVLEMHFDTTPFAEDIDVTKLEYVEDNGLCEYGTSSLDQLKCNVWHDLAYSKLGWFLLETLDDGSIKPNPISALETRALLIFK